MHAALDDERLRRLPGRLSRIAMDLRLRNLEQLDSRAVPLPHGTEVVTRVDRIVGERRVPQGSVGRVTKIGGRMERMKPADSVDEVLTRDQKRVMARVLEQEEAQREHVVVYLSGAHAYGFPSPDSDLDLKAIHVAKTEDLLGFDVPAPTVDRAEVIDGVEIDYTSNELAHALSGVLSGNGNFIEPTAKKLLYVLRTTLTGIHVLTTGELEADLTRLMDRYGLSDAAALVERKRAGERVALDVAQLDEWRPRVDALFVALDEARDKSALPEEPTNEAEVRAWLIGVRRARLA